MTDLPHARVYLVTGLLLATVASAPAANAADPCDAVYNAGIKSVQTPHHVYSTRTPRAGQAETSEAIFANGNEYLLRKGVWTRSPMPQSRMIAAAQEKLKTHPDSCSAMGDQSASGQSMSVYKVHSREMDTDQTVRIFKSSGLMQGGTMTMLDGGTLEVRYEYDNVQVPPGAK